MHEKVRIKIVAGVIIVFAVVCLPRFMIGRASTTQPARGGNWGEVVNGCRLGIRFDKKAFSPGEKIRLRIVLKNFGDAPVNVPTSTSQFGQRTPKIVVKLPNGKKAPLTLEGKRIVRRPSSGRLDVLNRGESRTLRVEPLNRIYDMTLAGDYKVVVRWMLAGEDSFVTVSSAPVELRISRERTVRVIKEERATTQTSSRPHEGN